MTPKQGENHMRTAAPRETVEARIVKRYHKLYIPLVELVQSVQDLESDGIQTADIELTRDGGDIVIQYTARAMRLIINDGDKRFTLQIEKIKQPHL
jgi:hypothetical protein